MPDAEKDATLAITSLLGKHRAIGGGYIPTGCSCGVDYHGHGKWKNHDAHVAAVLLAAGVGFVEHAKAEAWDEGIAFAEMRSLGSHNPYRVLPPEVSQP